jgi:hypothetical protein
MKSIGVVVSELSWQVKGSILTQVASFICLLYNPERFVLRYDTNFSGLGTPYLSCREFRAFNPEIVVKFFNSDSDRRCTSIRVLIIS